MVENTYNVVMVGTRGAGKTVFLAAMYKALRQFKKDRGFYLETESPNANALNQTFSRLNSRQWIDPTAYDELSEMLFTVRVRNSDGRVFSSCAFNYIDYAGGNLTTTERTMAADAVEEKLQDAHYFLALLDGFKLQQLVTEPDGAFANEFREIDLPATLKKIGRVPDGKTIRPIQFVISKWDHIEREGVTLGQIKQALFKIEEFKDFVETVSPKDGTKVDVPLRLIPVSAVGFEFVDRWDVKKDGQQPEMVIREGAQAKPWNVEMSMSCVLPDIFKAMQKQAIHEQKKAAEKTYDASLSWWQRLQIWAPKLFRRVISELIPKRWEKNEDLLQTIERILKRNADRILENEETKKEEFEAHRAELVANIGNEINAFELTLVCFTQLQHNLDTEFPESELN